MTVRADPVPIDSEVLGMPVYSLSGLDTIDAIHEVDELLRALDAKGTSYVVCKVPMEQLALIHALQRRAFLYMETQLRTVLRLKSAPTAEHDRYTYERIVDADDLEEVLYIAGSTIEHDRISRDPDLGPALSGERYRRYLLQSFEADDEEIWVVRSRTTHHILTFRSHRVVAADEVLLLNGGVHPDHKDAGLGVISSHLCFAQLRAAGVKRAVSHISAANAPIINLEVGYCTFRVTDTFAVLRRLSTISPVR